MITLASLDPYRYIPTNAPLTKAQIEAMAAEQRKKDEAAAAKERAAYEASKKSSNTYNTAKSTVANTKPTSYNTAQLQIAQALKNAGQTIPQPARTHSSGSERITTNGSSTTPSGNGYIPVSDLNRNPNSSVVTGGIPIAGFSSILDEIAKKTSEEGKTIADLVKDSSKSDGNGYVPVSDLNRPTNGSDITPSDKDTGSKDTGSKDTGESSVSSGGNYGGGGGGSSAPSAPSGGYYDGANWSGGMSYKPYPTAEEMANYVSTIIKAAKEELGGVKEPVYLTKHMGSDELITKPDAPTLRTLDELAKTFGIEYDYQTIYDKFNDSVEKQYDAIYQRQKQNEDAYYDNAAAAQNTLLDTLSRDRSNAVSAGVSKGMQAANALGAMLGVSQQFANNATTLSQERSNTAKDYGASLAKAVVDAEATSNERKNAIMEISKMLYGYDSEQYVANMDNYNTILTNNAALQQAYMNNRTALQNALASIFGGVAANKITGDANVQSSTLAAEAQKYAAYQSYLSNQAIADANRDAATTTADANKWIAQLQAGLLGSNEVPKADGTGTTNGGGSSNNSTLLTGALSTMPIFNTVVQNALGNVKDIVGATVTGLHNYKGMNK